MAHVHRRFKRDYEWEKIEKLLREELAKYVKIHKDHEKNLRYIG